MVGGVALFAVAHGGEAEDDVQVFANLGGAVAVHQFKEGLHWGFRGIQGCSGKVSTAGTGCCRPWGKHSIACRYLSKYAGAVSMQQDASSTREWSGVKAKQLLTTRAGSSWQCTVSPNATAGCKATPT